jgi:uncharacterized protein YegP (UPF0339 family)
MTYRFSPAATSRAVKCKFRFQLKAGNGEIIAVGEAYESKTAAKDGVESVKKNAADATVVDLTE